MTTALHILGIVVLFGVCLGALFALLVGLPGTFVIVAAALVYASATGFGAVTWVTLGWLIGLALVGEVLEFFAAAAGAASERPSRRVTAAVIVGGLIGGILGTPIIFGIGSLLGALAGAFAGAALAVTSEGGNRREAFSTGLAAMRGRLLGFVLKAAIAVVMVIILFAAVL